jgi:hypothetical protein
MGGVMSIDGRHGAMRSQERRDDQEVTTFAGLLLFLLITAAGVVVFVLAHQFVAVKTP